MEGFQLGFQYSAWWLLPGCFLAIGIAYWFYSGKNPFPEKWYLSLRILRALTWILLLLLLLNPLVEWLKSEEEPATIALLWDRSESIALASSTEKLNQIRSQILTLQTELESKGIRVETNLPDSIETQKAFKSSTSDLNKELSATASNYENRNLAGVVLLSDGIQNRGSSPLYKTWPFKIQTIGLGDTTRRSDVFLASATSNKLAFLGNKFPIAIELGNYGFQGETVAVSLLEGDKILEKRSLKLGASGSRQELSFLVKAESKGLKSYRIKVESGVKEANTRNNEASVLIEVIDGKQRILIAAGAPHPDIKAIRAALEKNENYEVVFWIPGIGPNPEGTFGLLILHQLPDKANTSLGAISALINDEQTPLWVITGSNTSLSTFNEWPLPIKIEGRSMVRNTGANALDKVKAIYEDGFPYFNLNADDSRQIMRFPPISALFGEYRLQGDGKVLLSQALGSVNTGKPLLAVSVKQGKRTAVLAGEGLWEWRIQEYGDKQSHQVVDGLIMKLVQFLATKEDKRKFRFAPIKESFTQSEPVIFEAEAYNALYEKLESVMVKLELKGKNGSTNYDYLSDAANPKLDIGLLNPGIYKYKASATVNGKNEIVEGSFAVSREDLEALDLTADHGLLRNIAVQNGGEFYSISQLEALKENLIKNPPKGLVRSFEEMADAISLKWLLFLIILLLTTEWGLRKYGGGY